MKIRKLITVFTLLLIAGFAEAQYTPEYTYEEYDPILTGDMKGAKETIAEILNDKRVDVDVDGKGKLKYKSCLVFDDKIVFNLKNSSDTFYFSDIFLDDVNIKFQSTNEKDVYEKGKPYDFYSDRIINTGVLSFYYKHDVATQLIKPHSFTIELTNALYFIQNQLNIQRYDSRLTAFKTVAEEYAALLVKPAITEEQRAIIVQANYYTREKSYEKAIELYKKLLTSDPAVYPAGYFNIALLYAQLERYEAAILNMKKYILLDPGSPDARSGQDKIYEWEIVKDK